MTNEKVDLLAGEISMRWPWPSPSMPGARRAVRRRRATSSAITEEKGHDYLVRVGTDTTTDRGRGLARLMKDLPHKRIFTITHDYEYGWRIISDFWDEFVKARPDVERVGGWT